MSSKKKPKARRVFTQADKDAHIAKLNEAMKGGVTLRGYAQTHGIAESVLRRWRELGTAPNAQVSQVPLSKRAPGQHSTGMTREQKLAAVAEYQNGGNAKDIAARLGITASGLMYWRKTLGDGGAAAKRNGRALVVAEPVNGNGHRIPQIAQQHAIRDATIFLRKAKHELLDGIRAGSIDDLDSSHLLSMLALKALTGGA